MAERTLIILKPDALQRALVGKIISRFEEKGLQLVGMKMLTISPELAAKHYAPHVGKPFYESLLRFMTSSPVVVMCLQGKGAIEIARKMMGATFGFKAEPGTIRGDFGVSSSFNLIHGSDSPESAQTELALWFKPEELATYDLANRVWTYDFSSGNPA
ncbi:MAG: nucleoside-diphosphate kinase [Phycisphaerae bacterium]